MVYYITCKGQFISLINKKMFEDLNLDVNTKEAVWLPPELKKQLEKTTRKENYKSIWRYIAMLHNNHQVIQDEKTRPAK